MVWKISISVVQINPSVVCTCRVVMDKKSIPSIPDPSRLIEGAQMELQMEMHVVLLSRLYR